MARKCQTHKIMEKLNPKKAIDEDINTEEINTEQDINTDEVVDCIYSAHSILIEHIHSSLQLFQFYLLQGNHIVYGFKMLGLRRALP